MSLKWCLISSHYLDSKISEYKNASGETILYDENPLLALDYYIQGLMSDILHNTKSAMACFNASRFNFEKNSKDFNLELIPEENLLKIGKNIQVNSSNLQEISDNFGFTPSDFQASVMVSTALSLFGKIYTLTPIEEQTTKDKAYYRVIFYGSFKTPEQATKYFYKPLSEQDLQDLGYEKEGQEVKIEISTMSFMEALEFKEKFLSKLVKKEPIIDIDFVKYISKYIKINVEEVKQNKKQEKQLDFKELDYRELDYRDAVFLTQGCLPLIYKIVFLTLQFNFCENKKKTQFLTDLGQVLKVRTEMN